MKTLLTAALVAALSLCLAGCVLSQPGKPDVSVSLPKAPAYYIECFNKLVKKPVGPLTREKVVLLIAELEQSDKRHTQCGKDLVAWYRAVRLAYAKKR